MFFLKGQVINTTLALCRDSLLNYIHILIGILHIFCYGRRLREWMVKMFRQIFCFERLRGASPSIHNGKERINNYLTRKPTSAFSLPYIPVDFQTYLFIDKTYASVFNTSLDIIQTEITTTLILVTL